MRTAEHLGGVRVDGVDVDKSWHAAARRHAAQYLDVEKNPDWREEIFTKLLTEEDQIKNLPEKYRARIRDEEKLMTLLRKAHAEHEVAAR